MEGESDCGRLGNYPRHSHAKTHHGARIPMATAAGAGNRAGGSPTWNEMTNPTFRRRGRVSCATGKTPLIAIKPWFRKLSPSLNCASFRFICCSPVIHLYVFSPAVVRTSNWNFAILRPPTCLRYRPSSPSNAHLATRLSSPLPPPQVTTPDYGAGRESCPQMP